MTWSPCQQERRGKETERGGEAASGRTRTFSLAPLGFVGLLGVPAEEEDESGADGGLDMLMGQQLEGPLCAAVVARQGGGIDGGGKGAQAAGEKVGARLVEGEDLGAGGVEGGIEGAGKGRAEEQQAVNEGAQRGQPGVKDGAGQEAVEGGGVGPAQDPAPGQRLLQAAAQPEADGAAAARRQPGQHVGKGRRRRLGPGLQRRLEGEVEDEGRAGGARGRSWSLHGVPLSSSTSDGCSPRTDC